MFLAGYPHVDVLPWDKWVNGGAKISEFSELVNRIIGRATS